MSQLEIDKRTYEDIINQIRVKAASYTPEWRFDMDNKDAGTALAVIYAKMLEGTLSRLNSVPEKNRIAFYNKTGADLKPSVPAEGYVTFSLVNGDVSGTEVPKQTQVFADVDNGERVTFETINDVYVTNAVPEKIYVTNKELDYISKIYDREAGENETDKEMAFFDYKQKNIQKHEFYISHPSVFHIRTEGDIILNFRLNRADRLDSAVKKALLDDHNVLFEYRTASGYQPFKKRKFEGDSLILSKTEKMPEFLYTEDEENGKNVWYDWIRCTVKNLNVLENMAIEKLYIRSQGSAIIPELIVAGDTETSAQRFYPFGERPTIMQEVYFVSEEVLSKRGAFVHLSFDLEYGKFAIENNLPEQEYDWKNIMKKSDFKVDTEYDITITQVIWEYYNGTGWTRLFENDMYTDIFHADNDSFRSITVNFQCPEDIQPFLVNSVTSYSIRARILKMSNLFKMKGNFITPCISHVRFKYEYIDNRITPRKIIVRNNLEEEIYDSIMAEGTNNIILFKSVEEKKPAVYIGFSKPLQEGPVKMMLMLKDTGINRMPVLSYEYSGKKRWTSVNMVDETENLRKTGIVTMMGNHECDRKQIFHENLYWLRITDVENEYRVQGIRPPVITGIHMNTTQIEAVQTMDPEYFDARPNQENIKCELLGSNIHRIEVWVNEISEMNNSNQKQLEISNKVRYEYTPEGALCEIWVLWKEVVQFDSNLMDGRVYKVDRINGIVYFSDGRNGRIPASGKEPTICVEYACGGGEIGNVPPMNIDKMNRSIGFVGEINNYDSTTGGCNQETVSEAMHRHALRLRHGSRAVTASDYENLAMEASRKIIRAKCCSNCNKYGQKEYGHVTLVLLQKDYIDGYKYFDYIRTKVKDYLMQYMSGTLIEQERFHIVEPEYIVMNTDITVVIREYNKVFEVRDKIRNRIDKFLNPVAGNFNGSGWQIGESPNERQLKNAIKDIAHISYIKNVRIDAYRKYNNDALEIDSLQPQQHPFMLPVGGEHKIVIEVE